MNGEELANNPDPTDVPEDQSLLGWLTLSAFFLVVGIAAGLYRAADVEPSAGFHLAYRLAFLVAIATWFGEYARRHHLALPLDMGVFLFAASFVLVPYFVLRAEGWRRGSGTLLMLLIVVVSSLVIEWGVGAWGSFLG